MANYESVVIWVKKAHDAEVACLDDISSLIKTFVGAPANVAILQEKIVKMRNLSRDLGFARRLLADLRKERGW